MTCPAAAASHWTCPAVAALQVVSLDGTLFNKAGIITGGTNQGMENRANRFDEAGTRQRVEKLKQVVFVSQSSCLSFCAAHIMGGQGEWTSSYRRCVVLLVWASRAEGACCGLGAVSWELNPAAAHSCFPRQLPLCTLTCMLCPSFLNCRTSTAPGASRRACPPCFTFLVHTPLLPCPARTAGHPRLPGRAPAPANPAGAHTEAPGPLRRCDPA